MKLLMHAAAAVLVRRAATLHHRGDRIYSGAGDAIEIEVRRADGSLDRRIRAAIPNRAVTAADLDAWRQALLASTNDRNRLPDRFDVADIGRDYVLGVVRDERDVPYVHLHRLERIAH